MPNNWKTYKLGNLIEINTNQIKKDELDWINYIDIKSVGTGFYEVPQRILFNDAPSRARRKLKNGDTVISSVRPNLKSFFYCREIPENAIASTGFVVLNSTKIDSRFLYYLTTNDSYINYLVQSCSGSAYPAFSPNVILESKVFIPESLQEQQSIASILSAIDDKIENNLAINKTLEEMAMALYKHWFVDFGPFQDGEFVESELGMIPKGWEVKKIGDVVSVIGGYAFKSKWFQETGLKVLKIKNINNNIVDISKCDCISETVSKSINQKFKVAKGDFLVAMTGAEVGKVGVVPNYHQDLWLNQRVGKFNDKEIKNASILIGKIMQTNDFYKIIQGLAYGSAQPNISTSDIENINIILPNDKNILNTLINDFVHLHNITIENLTENQTLTQLRDTLLPQLISGAVRLKEFRE